MDWALGNQGAKEDEGYYLTPPLKALTASLCSHNFAVAVKSTQRIGTLCFSASLTQWARVSVSALVLSDGGGQSAFLLHLQSSAALPISRRE